MEPFGCPLDPLAFHIQVLERSYRPPHAATRQLNVTGTMVNVEGNHPQMAENSYCQVSE